MAIEINGKVYRNLQEQVEKNKEDIEALQEQASVEYSAGDGIDIEEGVISVDDTVALKTDLSSYATKRDLNGYIEKNDDTYSSIIKGEYLQLQQLHGSGKYYTTTYNTADIVRKIHQDPSVTYTLNIPAKDGTLATTSDIPTYTAGTGIDITNNEVSIDNTVALKSELNEYIKDNDTNYASTFRGKGVYVKEEGQYTTTIYGDGTISRSIPRTEGYTYTLPSATGTLALTSDIPNYTGGSGITINSGNVVSADSTLARVADIPSITGLTMYNYKITISGLDGGTSGTSPNRSAVYIVSLPYQWDYSSLNAMQILRLVPVWSVVVDTDTSAGNKNMGRFHWQTGAISVIDWVDGTHTFMDFTGVFNATITAAQPAH